jgi:hypothetical protein
MAPRTSWGIAALAAAFVILPLPGAAQNAAPAPEAAKKATPNSDTAPKTAPAPAAAQKTPPAKVAAKEPEHPFTTMVGSWSGGGTLTLSSGSRERLRCRAHYSAGKTGRSLQLSIRCASDSYRFDLSSSVVNRRGRIYGRWSESSNGVSGTIAGHASGGRIRALARGDMFTAGFALTTDGGRQTVSIRPRDTFIKGVYIALRKR